MVESIEGATNALVDSGTVESAADGSVAGEASPGGFPGRAEDPVALRMEEVRTSIARGWAFTPLSGKAPTLKGWTNGPRATLEEVLASARKGNIGLLTGARSGVVVIDFDGDARPDERFPETVTVETGGGGLHLYYRMPAGAAIPNSVKKLGPGIDVRGDGGQVVFVGSIHPKTKRVYRWAPGRSPDEIEMAPLPAWILEVLTRRTTPAPPPADGRGTAYGVAALEDELRSLRSVAKGQRNDQLNQSTFALAQLAAGGELDPDATRAAIAAAMAPWIGDDCTEDEIRRTIESGWRAGTEHPRAGPQRTQPSPTNGSRPPVPDCNQPPAILTPGPHVDARGRYSEASAESFGTAVLAAMTPGAIYRRAGIPGELLGEPGARRFHPLDADRMRCRIDSEVRLVKWVKRRSKALPEEVFLPCSKDNAGLVLAAAIDHAAVRDLRLIVPCPAPGIAPGWNVSGVYYDEAPELAGIEPETDREVIDAALDDLVTDFPFRDAASRENFYGLLLTPLLRPLLEGNVPFHLITSPLERTGKTKLVEELLGGIVLGRPTPALQLSGSEEEREKRIIGLLVQGEIIVHLDNLREQLDSGALASLLTSSAYSGRMLYSQKILTLPNHMTVVGSGNNVRMTGELAKRSVPILLQPSDESPELRTAFAHPNLREYVRSNRRLILSCLLGMIANWEAAGRPRGRQRLGGFEAWVESVGGILELHGYAQWLGNLREWQRSIDPHGEGMRAFVETWAERYGTLPVGAAELMKLAEEAGVLTEALRGATEQARLVSFSQRVLARHRDAPIGQHVVRSQRVGKVQQWRLEKP
jgi:hypothetical protein